TAPLRSPWPPPHQIGIRRCGIWSLYRCQSRGLLSNATSRAHLTPSAYRGSARVGKGQCRLLAPLGPRDTPDLSPQRERKRTSLPLIPILRTRLNAVSFSTKESKIAQNSRAATRFLRGVRRQWQT